MSAAAKGPSSSQGVSREAPFEESLKKLESIVEMMESGDLPLEALLSRFEEGSKLAQVCQGKLAEAEVRIQQLEKNDAGQLVTKPSALATEG